MLLARIHEYKKPLVIEELEVPLAISGEQVLLRVASTGLCHSDSYLIDGELKDVILPSKPGHEVAGWVEKAGDLVPQEFGADYSVNINDKTNEQVSHEIKELIYGRGIDVVLDTVGLDVTTELGYYTS